MITLVNEYSAVLDACVLLPIKLCDLLLRLAEEPALYSPKWSRRILDEVEKNLHSGKFGLTQSKAKYRISCMTSAFPEAMVDGCESLVGAMQNHEKDRHVLACAVAAKADCIVTANSKDFQKEHVSQFGIEALSPDDFLIHQWGLSGAVVLAKVEAQARKSQRDLSEHVSSLGRSVPRFAAMIGQAI